MPKVQNGKALQGVGLEYDQNKGYAHRVHCLNCGWFKTIYVPYGIKTKAYLKDKLCERCQCGGIY